MSKRTALIVFLSIALAGTNALWLARAYLTYNPGTGHSEWERRNTADAAKGAIALIPLVASGHAQRSEVVEVLKRIDARWVPQERGNITYMGGLALEFGPDGELLHVYQIHSICC